MNFVSNYVGQGKNPWQLSLVNNHKKSLTNPFFYQHNKAAVWEQLDDTSSNQSAMTSITDIPVACATEKEGKIPKVSSDHTLASSTCNYEPRTCKSPNETNKKKCLFFKKDQDKDCVERRPVSDGPRPRLSLGDMRASWREFSGKHFGLEHNKNKKKHSDDNLDWCKLFSDSWRFFFFVRKCIV